MHPAFLAYSNEEKWGILDGMILVAHIDENWDEEEFRGIIVTGKAMGFRESEVIHRIKSRVDEVVTRGQEGFNEVVIDIFNSMSLTNGSNQLFDSMIEVAYADGNISSRELSLLTAFGNRLGLSEEEVKVVISRVINRIN